MSGGEGDSNKEPPTPVDMTTKGKKEGREEFKDTAEMKIMTTLPFPFPMLCVKEVRFTILAIKCPEIGNIRPTSHSTERRKEKMEIIPPNH